MGKLEGKIGLVTGGTSGIGFATARRFVDEGAHVFITGRRESELRTAVKEISRNVTGVQGDVSKVDHLDRLFAQIKREKGRLDVVFANAGICEVCPLGDDHRGILRFDFRHQCERSCLYRAESTASVAGWRLDRSEFVHRREQGTTFEQCLQRHQGCNSFVRADLDNRSQGSPYSGERDQSRLN